MFHVTIRERQVGPVLMANVWKAAPHRIGPRENIEKAVPIEPRVLVDENDGFRG